MRPVLMNAASLPPIIAERVEDARAVETLIEQAFGPGRLAKAAERLREGSGLLRDLSVVALDEGAVVGCARMWPIHVGSRPAILLGPFAVAPAWRAKGLGAALVEAACERARDAGHSLVMLVGDAAYFEKLGFKPVDTQAVAMPGPVDMRRVLVLALTDAAAEGLAGRVAAG